MDNVTKILKEVEELSPEEKKNLLHQLNLQERLHPKAKLDQYIGIAHGVWNIDPQEYITQLRADDR